MTRVAESKQLVDNILRLRRAERKAEVAADVAPVRADLEARLGPTLSRSRASCILGVSQTALDRWVARGEIPTVVTPTGRREVPRRFVVELAELIEELRRDGELRHPLSAALRERRKRAQRLANSISTLPTAGPPSALPRGHRTAEQRSLAYHRLVAERLSDSLVGEARRRLDALAHDRRIHPRYAELWREVLSRPIPEIAEAITRDDEAGRDLRQNTPFTGVLDEHEWRRLVESVH